MRIKIVIFIIFLFFILLLVRVYELSIVSYKKYNNLANENKEKTLYLAPIRGIIFDRNNKPIAFNKLRFNIALSPHLKKNILQNKLLFLKQFVNDVNITKLTKIYKLYNSPYNHKPITLIEYLDEDTIYKIAPFLSLDKDFYIQPSYLREYPLKEPLANVLGYVSRASVNDIKRDKTISLTQISGKRGIERYYDRILQGKPGEKKVIVNAQNIVLKVLKEKKPVSTNITLSIDSSLQTYIYNLLKKEKKRGAAVVVMKVNGEILSLVSYPSYNNNLFVKGISVDRWNKLLFNVYNPLLNKPVSGLYPPGSTVNPAEGLIAPASGKWNPWKKIYCPGYIVIGNRKFRDWRALGHGQTDLIKAIKRSADTYYYQLGLKLGINYLSENLKKMGFGKKTGIDLPHEKRGIVPNKEWKMRRYHQPWFIGETLNAVIGQGYFLATPLQVAVNTALIATGKLPKPFIVKKIDNNITKPIIKDVLSKQEKRNLWIVRKGMWEVCNTPGGTATNHIAHTLPFKTAGKTGTAQVYSIPQAVKKRKKEDELAYFHRSHAWLTTFAPYKNPQFVVTVIIEHGGHGGSAAGGIVSKIYRYLYDHHYIK